jgi:hypothetical protein
MIIRIRMLAFGVTVAGAALLGTAKPAYSTMALDPFGPVESTRRFCCAVDTNGDRRGDTWCCFPTGCRIDSQGCAQTT